MMLMVGTRAIVMQNDNPLETPLFRGTLRSKGFPRLASISAGLICGICVFDITAMAALRESRLMEMARPACIHSKITNEDLRHLVRHELQAGSSKKDVVRTVVSLCEANSRAG